jgi:hypothetical protein
MNVYVATPELGCPAVHALRMEEASFSTLLCPNPESYGEHFSRVWDRGQPFVIVEWDIVPWPGAVRDLLACPKPYCTHRYPLHSGQLAVSFGIGKYVPRGPAPEEWATTEWKYLDGAVVPVLHERLGRPHIHEPACAHARRTVPN